jgi:dihydrolipoamide dehydrogenase
MLLADPGRQVVAFEVTDHGDGKAYFKGQVMADAQFDVAIIGSGPGGYICAIRAAQLGMKVAVVEKDPSFGGTCLNVGCIPSKALLESSELYHVAREDFAQHGITVGDVKMDLKALLSRKDKVVQGLTSGVAMLFKKNKITSFQGIGRIAAPGQVEVTSGGKSEKFAAKHIVLATGSEPFAMPGIPFDGKRVVSSTEALSFEKVPKQLVVIGAGVIGLELGSVWLRLGADVTVVEMMPGLLAGIDDQIGRTAQRIFTKQGFKFHFKTKVTGVKTNPKGVLVTCTDADGKTLELTGDAVLVAIGRRPYADGSGAKEAGVAFDPKGRIIVDEYWKTNVPGIYAIGDVTPGAMLAHKAMDEGVALAERIAGLAGHVNYDAVPWIIYTGPEIAWVGLGEDQLKAKKVEYRTGSYPFTANPRARTLADTEGMVKILADARTDKLLGMMIIGPRAGDLIAEAAIAFEFGASAEDIARSMHAHPTLSEAVKEAALGVAGRTLHM